MNLTPLSAALQTVGLQSRASGQGATVWVLLAWAKAQSRWHHLEGEPGEWWKVTI